MTPALIMLVIPGLPSYNGVEVYYLKGVIGLPIVISFRDRWYIFFFWKWAHWWRHRHRLDRFRFQNFQSPVLMCTYHTLFLWRNQKYYPRIITKHSSLTSTVIKTMKLVNCLFVELSFYGPVNPLCTFFCPTLTTALLESVEGREWP